MAVFTAIAATISAISAWTVSLGALGTFAIGNFLLRAAVQLGVSALAMAFSKKSGSAPFSIQGSVRTGGSVPRSFVLGPGLSAGSLVWHSEWGEDGGTPNAYYTQVIALSDLPVAGLNRWFIEGRAVTLEDTGDERGLAAVEYREGEKDHAWIRFHDGTQLFADEFLTGTVNTGAPRDYEATRVGRGIAYAVVTFRVNAEIFTGFPTSKFVLNGVKLYDISKDTSQGGSGSQRWDIPQSWGGDGDALPAVQAYNLARGFYYRDPGAAGGTDENSTVALGADKSTLSLKLVGGGGGGLTNANGAATTVTLKDGATILQTWTAAGGMARAAADHIGVASGFAAHGNGAEGQERIFAAGEGGGEIQPEIKGGGAGGFVEITAYDLTSLTDPQLEIVIGAGATDAGSGYVVYTADQAFDTIVPVWVYGLQGLSTARLPAAHWIAQIEKCRTEIEGEDGLEPIYRCAGEVTVNSEIGSAFEAILTACAGRMSEVGGIFKIYVGAPDAPIAHFTDEDILSLAPQSFTPFFGLSDTVNGVVATYPSPDEGYVMRSTPPLYNPNYEIEDGGRRLLTDVQLSFVPFPAQAQRLLTGELAAARRARRHTHSLPARFRLIEPGDVVTWSSTRNGYDAKQFRVDGLIDLPNCDVIVDLTEVDPADHGSWEHASDYVPVVPVPLLPVRPSAQGVVGFQAQAAAVQDSAGQQRRAALVMTWNGSVEDIVGIKFQIRIAGQTPIVSRAQSRDFEEGELLVESGLVAATAYECRAKYITGTARPVSWTAWVAASTQDIRLMSEDFASSIRPPEIVSALPSVGNYEGRLVVFTVDGKLYRFHGGVWTAEVAAVDVTGQMTSSQLAGIEAAKLLGTVSSTQIATLAAEKLTGTINQARIAALSASKITGALSDSQIAAVSAAKISGQLSNGQLAEIDAAKIAGQLANTQIATIAAGKITGTLVDAQIAGVSALKISGQLSNGQLQEIDAAKIAGQLSNTQLAAIAATKITGTLGSTQIGDDAITTPKILSGAIIADKIAAGAIVADKIGANAVTTAKLSAGSVSAAKIAAGAITAEKVQAGAIGAAQIAAGAITAEKIAIGDFTNAASGSSGEWANHPWTITSSDASIIAVTGRNASGGKAVYFSTGGTSTKLVLNKPLSVMEGEEVFVEYWAWVSADFDGDAGNSKLRLGEAGTLDHVASLSYVGVTRGQWQRVIGTAVIPSDISELILEIRGNNTAGYAYFDDIVLRKRLTGELIVDGAITADTIATNAIISGKIAAGAVVAGNIAAGAIVAGDIASSAITTAKLDAGAVSAAKIATGAITADKVGAKAITAAKIQAGAVETAKIAAGAISAEKIAAGSVTATKLAIGGGGNLLENSNWVGGLATVVAQAGAGIHAEHAVSLRSAGLSFSGNYYPTLQFFQNGTAAGQASLYFHKISGGQTHGWPASPGGWYDASVQMRHFRAGGFLRMVFRDAAGSWKGSADTAAVGNTGGSNDNPDSWERLWVKAQAPVDTASIQLIVYKDGTSSGANSYLFLHKPMIAETHADATEPTPYAVSGATFITGNEILTGAILADHIQAGAIVAGKIAAGAIVASDIAANTITAAEIKAGAVTASELATGSVAAQHITADAIVAGHIATGAITSGMGVFSGPLQSDDFATGSAGWRIKKNGDAEFNDLIVRSSLTADAVSDGSEDYVGGAGQYNYDATVVDVTFEGQEGDKSVQPNRVFDIAAYWQMRCYGSNTASGNKIPVRGRVQYRLTVGGATGAWVDVHTSAPALNDTWADYYYIESFSFKADYVEFRLTAHPDVNSPSGAYSFQNNFRRIGISAYSVRR
nr:phage tail protein [Amylibacter sp.]